METVLCHAEVFTSGYKCSKMTNVMDADRSGRPSTSTTDEKQSEARTSIVTDRRPTAGEIALYLGVSQGTTCSLVHDILGFRKVSASRMLRHLTE
jgi:fibrillarin-like rRNA methylase